MVSAALSLLALTLLSPESLQALALHEVTHEFELVGRSLPEQDEMLTAAAHVLAQQALTHSTDEVGDVLNLTQVLSDNQGYDPGPTLFIFKGGNADQALNALRHREGLGHQAASHFGLGFASEGKRVTLALLLSNRRVVALTFPRNFSADTRSHPLCGELVDSESDPEVMVTRPTGAVVRLGTKETGSASPGQFCAQIPFTDPGRYTLEVVARGPQGPLVAALFFVDVGVQPPPRWARAQAFQKPVTLQEAQTRIWNRINALRAGFHLTPVTLSPELNQIALSYAQKMASEHFFSHISPEGSNLQSRLRAAHFAYLNAGENLGMASDPLAAHFAIELSPGHRETLLDAKYSQVGVGITPHIIVELFALPRGATKATLTDLYALLQDRRSASHLRPLLRSAALEMIASQKAQAMASSRTTPGDGSQPQINQGIFDRIEGVRTVSLEFAVASDLLQVTQLDGWRYASNEWVGIGWFQREDKYWLVVLYGIPE